MLRELGRVELARALDQINAKPLREASVGKGSTFSSWQYLIDQNEYQELCRRYVGADYWKAPIRWMLDGEAGAD